MSEGNELISVIVPVYNVEKYISSCIKSIICQTYKELEILLINDGSTDKSGEICSNYAKIDERIKIINTENRGVSAARNHGLDCASGQYIMFVDSDDTIEKEFVEELYETLKTYNADCVNCATKYVYENKANVDRQKNARKFVKVLNRREAIDAICYLQQIFPSYDMAAIWGCLYKKDAIKGLRFDTDIKIGEDFLFKFLIFQNIDRIACVNSQYYNYLVRSDSAMRSGYDVRKVNSVKKLENEIGAVKDEYKDDYISRVINIAIVILLMIPIDRKYNLERGNIIDVIKRYRVKVLLNQNTRKKVKIALCISYFGFGTLKNVFSVLNKN